MPHGGGGAPGVRPVGRRIQGGSEARSSASVWLPRRGCGRAEAAGRPRVRRFAEGERSPEGAGPRGGPRSPAPPETPPPRPSGAAGARLELPLSARLLALLACAWPGVPAQVGPRDAGCAGPGAPGAALRAQGRLTVPEGAAAARASAPRRIREDAGVGGGVASAANRRGRAASCCPSAAVRPPRLEPQEPGALGRAGLGGQRAARA